MTLFRFQVSDGGRHASGFRGSTGDCVTRAIAIASGRDYRLVYDELHDASRQWANTSRSRQAKAMREGRAGGTSPRNGVPRKVFGPYLEELGWTWTPTMHVGSGCTVHVRPDELPEGWLILNLSRHVTAVCDGVLYDTYDPSREGTRCVYGYWSRS